jgi:hypothetical protein
VDGETLIVGVGLTVTTPTEDMLDNEDVVHVVVHQ